MSLTRDQRFQFLLALVQSGAFKMYPVNDSKPDEPLSETECSLLQANQRRFEAGLYALEQYGSGLRDSDKAKLSGLLKKA